MSFSRLTVFLIITISAASAHHSVRAGVESSGKNTVAPRGNTGTRIAKKSFHKGATMSNGKKGKKNDSPSSNAFSASEEYFLTATIGPYPGSTSGVADTISGTVNLRFNPDGTFLTKFDLRGLLPGCTNCGAHVHEGTSCDDPSRPLGHYWDKELLGETAADDPWNYVFYNATQEGGSSSGFFMNSGFAMEDNEGHAFVIHTEGGDRVGCGVLKKQQVGTVLTASQFGRYPEYTGELQPEGSVEVEFMVDGSLKFSYDMLGLAPECVKCGVHIHTGLTCDDASLVLGHYWNKTEQVEDPWVPSFGAYYNTSEDGDALGFFHLFSGFNFFENEGHAIVFHNQDGSRVACGVLKT